VDDTFTIGALAPIVTSLDPAQGPIGSIVNIYGDGFVPLQLVTVQIGGIDAPIVNRTATRLSAIIPRNAQTGPIRVTTPGGFFADSPNNFTVTPSPPPTLTSVAPTSGYAPNGAFPGTAVLVRGTNFSPFGVATDVFFNGVQADLERADGTQEVVARVPAGATTGRVRVSTPGGNADSPNDFTVLAIPEASTITSFSPASGYALSTEITISGTNFVGGVENVIVSLGANPTLAGANPALNTTTTWRVIVAGGTFPGDYQITLITPGGIARSTDTFQVLPTPPGP
jgi:hypothetical protein